MHFSNMIFYVKDIQKSIDFYKKEKSRGQTVAYVRDPHGILIEIASKLS